VCKSDGLVVAVSGGPEMVVGDVAVRIYSRTDVDYFQEEVPLGADGTLDYHRAEGSRHEDCARCRYDYRPCAELDGVER
jgi:hypothetical protein